MTREELIQLNKANIDEITERIRAENIAKHTAWLAAGSPAFTPAAKTTTQNAMEAARLKRAADRLIFNEALAAGKTALELEQLGLEINFKIVWEVKPAQVNVDVHTAYKEAFIARTQGAF